MDSVPMQYYNLNKILLQMIGLWPDQSGCRFTKWSLRIGYNCFFLFGLISVLEFFIHHNFKFERLIEMLPVSVALFVLIFTNVVFYMKEDCFMLLWQQMMDDWSLERSEEELKIKMYFASVSHTVIKIISSLMTFGVICFIAITTNMSKILDFLSPLNETRSPLLPFPVMFIFDENSYYIILFLQHFIVVLSFFYGVILLITFITYVVNVYGMFTEIGYKLRSALPNNMEFSRETIGSNDEMYYKSMCLCIEQHNKAIQFAKIIDEYYGIAFATVLISLIFMASPTLFTLGDVELVDYKSSAEIVCIVCFFFVISYIGQKLIDLSVEVGDRA
ncbi:uncharacterized protein [Prorops nasuta]|uniref:uncharacterized protein n=1 Tax=Prorops nasuta TaxID=863751 RepID=UPI0034CFD7DF